ncbi:hypothetical protein ACIHFD_50435 [Nonomuraea sp. NPDC051941]|uniref:hypothetical protein n=1 Tax=Nonomuraea sp. NPDC051941 TaxID=3364373 RepID=UPI0037CCBA37
MSGGFKIPVPGGTPDPFQPGDEGGDLKRMQYSTLGMYAFAALIFPVFERVVVAYGLSVPSDPQVMHRAADGWSAFGDGVYAAGATAREQHDSVSQASWQAPERELYGQRVAGYAMESDTAADSAHSLSWMLRVLANLWTLYIYLHVGIASLAMATLAKALLAGPGRVYYAWEALSQAMTAEKRVIELRNFTLRTVLGLALKYGAAWMTERTLTDGLKPQYAAGRSQEA